MKPDDIYYSQTWSYLALRRAVGWIGILLPLVLFFGDFLLSGKSQPLLNISLYYHTPMRDVFVGSVCAIGLFMFYYRGYDKWDNIAGNLAGLCTLGIAWFPTTRSGHLDFPGKVHFISAAGFFLLLSCFSLLLFTRKRTKPTRRKRIRNRIYIACGIVMLLCLLAIVIFFNFLQEHHPDSSFVFWAETTALCAFGISWLTKGGSLYPDKKI